MQFFALCWPPGPGLAPVLTPPPDETSAGSWSITHSDPGLVVWAAGPRRPPVVRLPGALVIGDLHHSDGEGCARGAPADEGDGPLVLAQWLASAFWGRYVAVLDLASGHGPSVFRDPSGAVEALTWRCGHVVVVASTLPDFLLQALPPKLSLDFDQIAKWLASPAQMAGPSALTGVHALAPGALARPGGPDVQVWRPCDWIKSPAPSPRRLPGMIESAVDQAVSALSSGREGILVEVSGGLDSSIVAAALARAPSARVAQWLNYRAASGEGDERAFARLLADALSFELVEAEKPPFVLNEDKLMAVSGGLRPGLNGLDCERDVDVGLRAQAAGADTIFTGQGGDMVFFQAPSPLVAADLVHLHGLSGLTDPALIDTARWLRRSVWSLASTAWLERKRGRAAAASATSFIRAEGAALTPHPWLEGLEDAPPAKRLQVQSLVEKQTLYGENRRSRRVDVVHPLLAQPIVELCLATPTPLLTQGGRDRALARQAFAHRLPAAVVDRRTKGSLGGYYARTVGDSLAFLRPFLLDGRLAQLKLIDTDRLAMLLTREQLAVRGDYPTILYTAMVEAWVRRWEERSASSRRRGSAMNGLARPDQSRGDQPVEPNGSPRPCCVPAPGCRPTRCCSCEDEGDD